MIIPNSRVAFVGSPVTFICLSDSSVRWYKGKSKLTNNIRNIEIIPLTLTLVYVTLADKGTYTCKGTHVEGKKFRVKAKLYVGGKKRL